VSPEKPNPLAKGLSSEVRVQLQALGVAVKAWNPSELEAVIQGHRTLGELAGVTKERQFELQAMGLKLLKDGLKDKALEVFHGLEALDPYDAYVQVCLGTIAFQDEDYDGARARFDRALSYNPSSVPALAYRGEVLLRQGKRAEAIADLERALASPVKGNDELLPRVRALLEAARQAK